MALRLRCHWMVSLHVGNSIECAMKSQLFLRRASFAWSGVIHALKHEASFRTQITAALCVIVVIGVLRPPAVWVALLAICVGLVLAAELFNTALEATLDGLHPESATFVRVAKDCAAAAVLVLSGVSVVVFVAMLSVLLEGGT
jgi:diacylglycerol kinase